MEKIFNIMLLIGILYILYLYIQKYKPIYESKEQFNNLDKVYYINNEKSKKCLDNESLDSKTSMLLNNLSFTQIVNEPGEKVLTFSSARLPEKSKDFSVNEPYQAKLDKLDSLSTTKNEPGEKVKFNYINNEEFRPINNKFLKEREFGSQLSTWYPNTWIERIDENGEPVYNSRENVTGIKEDFIESKARFTYEFNSPRSVQMNGIIDPDDFKDGSGITLKEIYDNSFVDYKKMVPKKKIIETDPDKLNTQNAGSNLSFISPDTWIYEQENPENGGKFENGLMADDPFASNSISNSLAIIDY